MKAVIMAGGRGVRLQPISIGCPKPLIPVFDKPVMEHILELLKRHGIREVRATLQYMPDKIIRYFEENPPDGIELSYSVEDKPLGTAGSVAVCRDFLGDEDFLVISGDAICDMDLTECINRHRANRADATIVLYRHPKPLEYGLVMTGQDGRIERFIEKPTWSQVFCDTVNTGIYILKPKVLDRVRPGVPVDFAKDIFRDMLREGVPLYGTVAEGYWCDIGGPDAYMDCHFDILSGKTGIGMGAPHIDGYCVMSEIPAGVKLHPPVYIGKGACIGRDAEIGPYTVIGQGSAVGAGVIVESSLILGAKVRDRAEIRGAIICGGATVGRDAAVSEGCVVGEKAEIEDSVALSPGVKVWPGLKVRRGSTARFSIYSEHGGGGSLPFDERSDIRGDISELTPEICLRIGFALGNEGPAAVGYAGGPAAETLAQAISCGVRSAGSNCVRHDARFLAEASFASDMYGAVISAFVEGTGGDICIRIVGKDQTIPSHETERKLNLAVRADMPALNRERFGSERFAIGAPLAYEQALSRQAGGKIPVRVIADNTPARLLKSILEKGRIIDHAGEEHCITLGTSPDGTDLHVIDENGNELSKAEVEALLSLVHFREGNRILAVSFDAPHAIETIALSEGARTVRRGRDGEYEQYAHESVFMRDALMAALKLCKYISSTGTGIAELYGLIPRVHVRVRNAPYAGDRGALMRALSTISAKRELGDGLRFPHRNGWIHVSPSSARPLIRIIAESSSAEAAEELCADISALIRDTETGPLSPSS
jgi:mannose-1-phosphate guanylyltransferase/phosphomannomutase